MLPDATSRFLCHEKFFILIYIRKRVAELVQPLQFTNLTQRKQFKSTIIFNAVKLNHRSIDTSLTHFMVSFGVDALVDTRTVNLRRRFT